MRTTIKAALALLLLAGSAWAFQEAVGRSTFVDATHGFSMEAPKFPGDGPAVPGTVVLFSGPPKDGFASNVNVIIQATPTTAKAYRDLSTKQLQQLNLKLFAERQLKVSGRDAVELGYEGTIGGGRPLRFLSLAVIDKDRVVLVTCTATPEGYAAAEPEFRKCLESFKLP